MGRVVADLATTIFDAARRRRPRLVEMLAEITALDAPSGDAEALAAPAALLSGWLEELGARTAVVPGAKGRLLDARLGEGAGAGALILCHYDTVWSAGTVAERPFEVDGEVARGPGVVDMRGGIVACLGALATLAELGLERPVRLILTPDEETGSEASRAAIEAAAGEASLVLVPEPALPDGSLKTARKGWLLVRLVARGVAAHAGLEPERGASAVDELVAALAALRELGDGETTVNVGLLGAANPANVVAELAEATVDLRFVDAAAAEGVRAALGALRPRDRRARLEVEELHSRPPLVRTAASAAAAARVRRLAGELGLAPIGEGAAGGVSDANLAALGGAAILDGIGPVGGGAHARDEWVDLGSLVERSALIALLLADDPNPTQAR
ncbi:MAG TPA: M20/M25/M40 family metallo-hydrolase [Solirubrobacterales bacterium]|nr:M20/M25/M40 family metallo-hydrolase [Solirubrobacterales bacterium]